MRERQEAIAGDLAMTTIRDVAKAAGASTATVSHVLNASRFVSAETKTRVEEAIRALHYRPHGIARSLRRSRTHTIGVMISDIANPFFADLVLGVEDVVPAAAPVGVLRGCDFELPALLRRRDVDARGCQPVQMPSPVLGRKHVKGAVSATDAVADEPRNQEHQYPREGCDAEAGINS
jgi:Bacterial regulatory proteins, lacI family